MKELIIKENEAGQRLDKFLGKYMELAPKSFFYKMMRKKNIVLNGKKVTGNEKLIKGDQIKLFLADETIEKFQTAPKKEPVKTKPVSLAVVYEDDHIILMNKPVGLLSQKAQKQDVSINEIMIQYLMQNGENREEERNTFRPSICNRLDRNTSGMITGGKSMAALQTLNQMFQDRSLRKYYRCIVVGTGLKNRHIKGYLYKDTKTNQVMVKKNPFQDADPIETEYKVIAEGKDYSLLEVHLITGKTHQIRAHLASIGHPIIGDYKYGDKRVNDRIKSETGLQNQLLHSYRIEFPEIEGELSYLSGKQYCAKVPKQFAEIQERYINGNME